MHRQTHQQLVSDFFMRFVNSDIEGLLALLDDQVVWKMMGQQGGLPVSGEMDKAGITGLMQSVRAQVGGRLNMTPRRGRLQVGALRSKLNLQLS
ncbi:nuclear transport factor 2 family protein [Pseudoalteromonas aurantia]|uniref:SnoaL-like domain-containing protein n=1 Tax=Pseudoalteromonas aurantia 208 TaxID=1314867 RepID=A0ABR9E7F1_9GAMM|nr:hypothetical protein [Pseudoalteromonas aurantia]MBE0366925.1 hypothetical protein [Pseudoalteromonas aurantia 208]